MKKSSLVLLVLILLSVFCFPVMASEKISSMSDLEYLEESQNQARVLSTLSSQNEKIVILYQDADENNIGKLDLNKEDFTAGRTVDEKIDILQFSDSANEEEIIAEIEANDNVLAVDYNIQATILDVPNDPFYSYQTYYSLIGADKNWQDVGQNSVKVAVIDTGVDLTHEDMVGRYNNDRYDFIHMTSQISDQNGHGTAVSSVIAANTNNSKGIAGISGKSPITISSFQALDSQGYGELPTIAAALSKAISIEDIRVINLSFGVESDNSIIRSLINLALSKDKIIVAASGNNDKNSLYYPAKYDGVIAVGSVDNNLSRSTSSSWGKNLGSSYGAGLTLMAPATKIPVCYPGNNYALVSGTSFAAPQVSAAVAVLLSNDSSLTNVEVKQILTSTAKDLGSAGYDTEYGYGLVQLNKALEKVVGVKQTETNNNSSTSTTEVSQVKIRGIVHIQDIGDVNVSLNNPITFGTTGQSKRLEAITLSTDNPNLKLNYSTHVQDIGWMATKTDNQLSGTTGQSKRLEAITISLSGADASKYDIYYRVHIQDVGWMNWAKNGQQAGSAGFSRRMEALQIQIVPKGSDAPSVNPPNNTIYSFISK